MYCPRDPSQSTLREILIRALVPTRTALAAADVYFPSFVWRALEAIIDCGVLDRGFVRVSCTNCRNEQLVGFSCKGRGACSSCVGRRMAELSEHLVAHKLPRVPVRQFVLTLPVSLRVLAARDARLLKAIRATFLRAVSVFIRGKARQVIRRPSDLTDAEPKKAEVASGGLCVVQRTGSALNLNPHFHALFLDGAFVRTRAEQPRFHAISEPTRADLLCLLNRLVGCVLRLLKKRGFADDEGLFAPPDDQQTLPLFAEATRVPKTSPKLSFSSASAVSSSGFTLHAAAHVAAHDLEGKKRLCRYILRPAIANNRLTLADDGSVAYEMKRAFEDGQRVVVFDPQTFVRRIAFLIPPPRAHEVTYFGVLAANAKWRRLVVPVVTKRRVAASAKSKPHSTIEPSPRDPTAEGFFVDAGEPSPRLPWAELIRRTFKTDVLVCPDCGGARRVIAAITEPAVIKKILAHLSLAGAGASTTTQRPRAPPVPVPLPGLGTATP